MGTVTIAEADGVPSSPVGGMSLGHVWAFLAGALPAIVSLGAIGTADLAYQIRAGQLMWRTHALIRTDPFSFTAMGHPWTNQQWLAQLMLAAVYRPFGWPGLSILQAALVAAVFGLIYLACRAAGASPMRAALLALAGFAVASTGLALRPQLMAAVLFALTLWLVAGRARHPGRMWLVPAVVVVWANVHGSFPLGAAVVGLAWLADLSRHSTVTRTTASVTVASLLATLVNPLGPRVWTYVIGLSTNPLVSKLVTEWRPPVVRHADDALFFISAGAVAVLIARSGRAVRWPHLLTIGVFFFLALTATRNTLWWALAAPPAIAGILSDRTRTSETGEQESPLGARSMLNTGIVACVAALFVAFAFLALDGTSLRMPGANAAQAPRGITVALARELRPGDRVFNAQPWGSWFELAVPHDPVFVDSRVEVFPPRVWDDYLAVSSGKEGWQDILRRWNVRAVVADWAAQSRLIPLIRRDPGWREAYEDEDGVVFLRR